jgi:hypothetical protein
MTKYLLKSSPKNEQKQDSDLSSNEIAFQNLIHEINDDLVVHFKIFLECFILTNETKIPLNGLVLGACYNTCLWHSWNLFSTCKKLSDLFWKHCSCVYLYIFYIAITVVNNFNCTWYKIVHCGHFLQNKRIHLFSSNSKSSYHFRSHMRCVRNRCNSSVCANLSNGLDVGSTIGVIKILFKFAIIFYLNYFIWID